MGVHTTKHGRVYLEKNNVVTVLGIDGTWGDIPGLKLLYIKCNHFYYFKSLNEHTCTGSCTFDLLFHEPDTIMVRFNWSTGHVSCKTD